MSEVRELASVEIWSPYGSAERGSNGGPLLQVQDTLTQSADLRLLVRYSITHVFLPLAIFSTRSQDTTSSNDRSFFSRVGRKLGLQ